jgi:hypothetical protein
LNKSYWWKNINIYLKNKYGELFKQTKVSTMPSSGGSVKKNISIFCWGFSDISLENFMLGVVFSDFEKRKYCPDWAWKNPCFSMKSFTGQGINRKMNWNVLMIFRFQLTFLTVWPLHRALSKLMKNICKIFSFIEALSKRICKRF